MGRFCGARKDNLTSDWVCYTYTDIKYDVWLCMYAY